MRTSIFLPFVYLSSVGKTVSLPGTGTSTSQEIPALPEQKQVPGQKVFFVRKSLVAIPPLESSNREANVQNRQDIEKEFHRRQEKRKTTFAVSLAAVSGVLDVVCFQKFGCFAHLMTGNTVKFLTAATELKWKEASFYAAMVAAYVAGAAVYRLVDILHTKQQTDQENSADGYDISTIFRLSVILLPVFALSDVLVRLLHWPTSMAAMFWAFGGGVVNASTMNAIGIVTNAVTGHWNKLGMSFADFFVSGKQKDAIKVTYKVLTATALCVCATKFITKFMSTRYAFAPPIGAMIGMTYFALFRWYGKTPSPPSC